MAELNDAEQKLTIKLVYYGPAQSGKTTNISCLHQSLQTELKGEMMALETKGDRTLFFDLLPLGVRCDSGLMIKLKLFTVPGQVAHDSTRKAVLSRADGVVFVADSQTSQSTNNMQSFENLDANITRLGGQIEQLPLVIQFNKRDLPNIVSEQEVRARWQATPWPLTFASALKGEGIRETFRTLLHLIYPRLDAEYGLSVQHGLAQNLFIDRFSV